MRQYLTVSAFQFEIPDQLLHVRCLGEVFHDAVIVYPASNSTWKYKKKLCGLLELSLIATRRSLTSGRAERACAANAKDSSD